jgi:hypothetical protein
VGRGRAQKRLMLACGSEPRRSSCSMNLIAAMRTATRIRFDAVHALGGAGPGPAGSGQALLDGLIITIP